jgi:hypothetical protein
VQGDRHKAVLQHVVEPYAVELIASSEQRAECDDGHADATSPYESNIAIGSGCRAQQP